MFIMWIMFYALVMKSKPNKLKLAKTRSPYLVKLFYTLTTISDHCQASKFCAVYHDHYFIVKHKIVKFLLSTTDPRVSRIDNGFGCVKR
jgi:hypothetical protein